MTSIWFVIVVGVHVESQVIHLVESLVTNVTLVCLFSRVSQSVVLVVSFLMKSFPTKLADIRLVAVVYSHVCVQCRTPIKCLPALTTLMRLLIGMDYLVSAQGGCLSESFTTNFTYKWPGSCMNWHVSG